MPIVKVVANQNIGGNKQSFGFDYSHLPNLNDKNIVSIYYFDLFWYQNREIGRPPSPTIYYPYMYDWKNGDWVGVGSRGSYAAAGSKGWASYRLSWIAYPTSNKVGANIGYDDYDTALGTPTTPYINVNYTLRIGKATLEKMEDAKENEPINISWTTDIIQTSYEARYTNNSITTNFSGTTAKTITINRYTLKPGKLEYEVRFYNGYTWSEWAKGNIDILEHHIYLTLEPNKIAQNKDKPIVAMWSTTDPQTQFKLLYSGGGTSGEVTGTTAKTHTFPAGTFGNGNVTLTLEVFNGYVWTEKVAEFMAYGAPPKPTLTTQATYTTATPNITWTANEQVSYRLQILKDDVVVLDSSDVYSSNKSHKFVEVLENNTTYVAKLRIRNQYEIESEWVSKPFKIAFTELQKPYFDMFCNDNIGTVMFNIYNATGQSNFKHCEVLRREYSADTWDKLVTGLPLIASYTDYTPRSGVLYEYKVRAIGTNGGYTDSEIELKEVSLRNTMLSDTSNFEDFVMLIHNPKKSRIFVKETHLMLYSGLNKPRIEYGNTKYTSTNISFKVDGKTLGKLEELYYSNSVLLLRDSRGKQLYGTITSDLSVEDSEFEKYDVGFTFTETQKGVLV